VPSQCTILDLVDHIYGAVEDQARWPSFLEDLAGTLRVSATNLFMQDLHQPRGNAFATFATDPSFTRSYAEYYGKINVFLIKGQKLLRSGNVSFSSELCPDHEARRSEFFNDWVLPQGQQHGLLGTIYNQNSLVGNIGAIRAPGAKPFTPADKRLLQTLMPHLQRAVRLRRRIADLETLETRTADALDHWTTAVFLVDSDTRVILANRTAVDLLGQRDGLLVERGILKTSRSRDTVMLHRLIREAVATTIDRNDHASGAMLIERISGKAQQTPSPHTGEFIRWRIATSFFLVPGNNDYGSLLLHIANDDALSFIEVDFRRTGHVLNQLAVFLVVFDHLFVGIRCRVRDCAPWSLSRIRNAFSAGIHTERAGRKERCEHQCQCRHQYGRSHLCILCNVSSTQCTSDHRMSADPKAGRSIISHPPVHLQ
jgi:PAS domain-containing protein